jgi:putative hemolysin
LLLFIIFIVTVFFLIGTFFLTAVSSAFRRLHRRDSKKEIIALGKLFFYRPFHLYFFPMHEYEGLLFATICAQNIARFCYAASAIIFLLLTPLFHQDMQRASVFSYPEGFSWFWAILSLLVFMLFSFVVGDYLPRILGMRLPEKVIRFCTPFCSIFMFLVFPITFLFLKISQSFSRTIYLDHLHQPMTQAKHEIIEIIREAQLSPDINPHDKQLIESVLSFRERIAREVMVPRVDVFSLSANTSIKEAASILAAEGYSRTPIYRNSVDNIVGVLMYKDILTKFREYEEKGNDLSILEAPIETIQKNVLYTPETKKISNLLQEFRKKQVHLAIVVDEYGGTEGIVTIEDILEVIVGDISDEYDEEERLYVAQPDGSWIVDARMNIFDVEEQLGIKIPQDVDYDTIGGYIFHRAGAIPSKGFIIHQDEFEMEIIDSNERVVEKVRLKPIHGQREGIAG